MREPKRPDIKILHFHQPINIPIRKNWFRLMQSNWYLKCLIDGKLFIMRIDFGYEWDGASIRWWLWTLLRLHPGSIMLGHSLPHDPLCNWYRGVMSGKVHLELEDGLVITPFIRDHIFRKSCENDPEIGEEKAEKMWKYMKIYQKGQAREYNYNYYTGGKR